LKSTTLLLINPPIYDFAAHDLWAKPVGLLYIARILMDAGMTVHLLDYMDRYHAGLEIPKSNIWGCGHYYSQITDKPEEVKIIPRYYHRYGISKELACKELKEGSAPDAVLVTSGMSYWYPGVIEAIETVKGIFPTVPVLLGGTYATLCSDHALKHSGADHVLPGAGLTGLTAILRALGIAIAAQTIPPRFADFPHPAYELYRQLSYISLRTTVGCPFKCSYCAAELMSSGYERKSPDKVVREIDLFYRKGIKNFAFYDDALFVDAEQHCIPLLQALGKKGICASFHSPNGLHARYITPGLARLLKETGFVMPRLSLETSSAARQRETGSKVSNNEFLSACRSLRAGGYQHGEYGAYIMMGMPGQCFEEVEETIHFAYESGARVFLAEYSPIPGTRDWERVKDLLPSSDPLWHNNSLFPLFPLSDWPKFQKLKDMARDLNKCFT